MQVSCAVVVERDSSEFARLSQLGDILGLNPMEINSVHTGLAEQAYRSQVQQVCPSREREILHLFQPPRADQMPDPCWGQCHNIRPDSL